MTENTVLRARINSATKSEATAVLAAMLTLSDAARGLRWAHLKNRTELLLLLKREVHCPER